MRKPKMSLSALISAQKREKQEIKAMYHREYPSFTKKEIKKMHGKRIAYARRYKADAIKGIPPGF